MKTLFCSECRCKIAEIASGSKLKKGMVLLCSDCEKTRITAKNYIRNLNNSNTPKSPLENIFRDIFR